jgi:uncharacterized protein YciI
VVSTAATSTATTTAAATSALTDVIAWLNVAPYQLTGFITVYAIDRRCGYGEEKKQEGNQWY